MVKLTWIEELNNTEFESSSEYTDQFKRFYNLFNREMRAFLKSVGATKIDIHRMHFGASGFFTFGNQVWYFSLEDVRWDKVFLIRKAKDYKDYTGGSNLFLSVNDENNFINDFYKIVLR